MNAKDLLRDIRKLQTQLKEMESNYKLGLYSYVWYTEHITSINKMIEIKKKLYASVYNINDL